MGGVRLGLSLELLFHAEPWPRPARPVRGGVCHWNYSFPLNCGHNHHILGGGEGGCHWNYSFLLNRGPDHHTQGWGCPWNYSLSLNRGPGHHTGGYHWNYSYPLNCSPGHHIKGGGVSLELLFPAEP